MFDLYRSRKFHTAEGFRRLPGGILLQHLRHNFTSNLFTILHTSFDNSTKLGFILKNRLMVFEPETKLVGGISSWQLRAS